MFNDATTPTDTPPATLANIPIHIVFQIIEVCVCAFLCGFYGFQRYRGRCGWEVLYVSFVTPIGYILNMTVPRQYSELRLENGQVFYWFRYAGWLATCPIMLELLCRIVVPRKPSTDMLMKVLILDIMLIICGITSALQKDLVFKFVFFSFGGILNLLIYGLIFRVWSISNDSRRGIPKNQASYRRNVMILTFITWTCFPVLFLLGPETFGVISVEYSIVGHVLGDLLSKNLYSFLSWHFRNVFMKRNDNVASAMASTAGSMSTLDSDATRDFDNFSLSQLSGFGGRKKKRQTAQAQRKSSSSKKSYKAKNDPEAQLVKKQQEKYLEQQQPQMQQRNSSRNIRPLPVPEDSDTDMSEWNANGNQYMSNADKSAGMRSEWESNLSLAEENANPPTTFKRQSSKNRGNGSFLETL